ncbi:MAG: DUF4270 family protein [Bacteroidota bacterium]
MKPIFRPLWACAIFLTLAACTEPITIGSDLVEGELANIGQVTDLPFTTRVVREDSLLTHDATDGALVSGFNFGRLTDDVAGSWAHGITFVPTLFLSNAGNPTAPSFVFDADTQVDSIVMIIPIDTAAGFYSTARTFPIELRRLANRVDEELDYFTDDEFATTGDLINKNASFTATGEETILFDTIYPNSDSFPHVRITLSDDFVADFNTRDTSDFTSEDNFYDFFPGVSLQPGEDFNGMINLRPATVRTGTRPIGGFYFFFPDTTDQDPVFISRPFDFWLPTFEKDFTGSLAGDLLADGLDEEQLLVAGQTGAMIEINFPDLSSLAGTVINQAEITFFREDVDGYSYDDNPPPSFVALYYRNSDGELVNIEDRDRLGNTNSDVVRQFLGGNPEEDDAGNVFYRPRFSVHMQRMINGEVPRTMFLQVVPVDRDPSRVVLGGPASPLRPASVKVTFTELD